MKQSRFTEEQIVKILEEGQSSEQTVEELCRKHGMPRPGTTQARTFVYDGAGRLTSATNPEYGAVVGLTYVPMPVSYAYNSDNTLLYKLDAKGQETVYSYDSLKRLTMAQYFPTGVANPEDACQRVTYSYDTNPYNSTFSQNSYGRLTAVLYGASGGSMYAPGAFCTSELTISGGTVTYFADMYSYHPAGAVTAKRLWMARGSTGNPGNNFLGMNQANVDVDYTYDSAGRTATTTYPMAEAFSPFGPSMYFYGPSPPGITLTYGYDSMGRPNSLTDASGATGAAWSLSGPINWVQNVQYDYAGRLNSMQYITYMSTSVASSTQKTMGYNVDGQLTSLGWAAVGSGPTTTITYNYSATQNNGQITQVTDQVSGETIAYQYDSLKRLTSASSTPISGSSPAAYNQSYQYDGFGNLTGKVLNGAPTPILVNPVNNRLSTASYYDANGNMTSGLGATLTYDEANRIASAQETTSGPVEYYGYSADNKRFYKYTSFGTEQLTLYGARGEKLGVYTITNSMGLAICPSATNIWFAGKLILESNQATAQDRLGTNRSGYVSAGPAGLPGVVYTFPASERFYPYGEEITSTLGDHEKFATYTRDDFTGFDYADQRYYASSYGRFNTADASGANWDVSDPLSWNAYIYAEGDPINYFDPSGLAASAPTCGSGVWTGGLSQSARSQDGQTLSSILAQGANSDFALLAETIFTESSESTTELGEQEMGAIAAVIMNRYQILNGYWWLQYASGTVVPVSPDLGPVNATVSQVMWAPSQFAVWQSPGTLAAGSQSRLDYALNKSEFGSGLCNALSQALGDADLYLSEASTHTLYTSNNFVLTAFNSSPGANPTPPWETQLGQLFETANVFYGIQVSRTVNVVSVYGQPTPPSQRPTRRRSPPRSAR